jgi:hypothetical protein
MSDPEIPFSTFTFETIDPDDIHILEQDNHNTMTLRVAKMSFDYSSIKPGVKFTGLCLRFSEHGRTPEGKVRGICFYVNYPPALDHLINELLEARNQLFGVNINDQN